MRKYVEQGMKIDEYIDLIDRLLEAGKTTGEDQSEKMLNYGKLNRQRMKRLDKTVKIKDSLAEKARDFNREMIWLIITEGWCGDAAQNLPVVEKIAAESENIETRYVLRDENLELMDQYLTNSARSIPVLIALDADTLEEVGTWGPRPKEAMEYRAGLVEEGLEKAEISEKIQRWYLSNKEESIQEEFGELLEKWKLSETGNQSPVVQVGSNNVDQGRL